MVRRLRGSYGVDAPYVPAIFAALTVAALLAAVFLGGGNTVVFLVVALVFAASCAFYLHTTLVGKFELWADLLRDPDLRACRQVLDVGCGRAMAMLTAAIELPESHVTGIDLWRVQDQSGNSIEMAERNAAANGLTDRVTLDTGDMTRMPYPDGSFDLVLASVSIQNVKDRELRRKTIDELVRVSRSGARIRIVDIQYAKQYAADLAVAGAADVTVTNLGWRGWFGNPFYASRCVSALIP